MKHKASMDVFLDPKLKKRDEKFILASSFTVQTNKYKIDFKKHFKMVLKSDTRWLCFLP